jgi:glyoxylase-like metal-dependent hydrolase (beta-lactamase superfamily II)
VGEPWQEIGDRVYVRRHAALDLNVGLVVGEGGCLVIDTRATLVEAADLVAAVRRVTPHPWTVVNTHTHWDHYFGNAAFRPAAIWAHERAVDWAVRYGAAHRERLLRVARARQLDELAAGIEAVTPDPPDRPVAGTAALDIAGRPVVLRHLGRGHTDGDLVVEIADTDVLFAGDLIEEGGPVGFSDAFPLDWPDTAAALLPLCRGPVVPGHGAVVDRAYVAAQQQELAATAALLRRAHAESRPASTVWPDLPYPEDAARYAVTRAYRQLDNQPPYDPPEAVAADDAF